MERPTPEQIQAFMSRHNLSQIETARRAGISVRTLIRYLKSTDRADRFRLKALAEFMARVDRRSHGKEKAE